MRHAAGKPGASANGGQILVSDVVPQIVAGKEFAFTAVGERRLRWIRAPVRIWELDWLRA